ncbi:MAG: peptidylprolyl isomerase [Paludibacteraceae bacterium]|jgi:peptidyl-prolyl cis-trans isomerase SurA|nr:peptidylprolyl isomerase [Paludibacteraceae bacterium]MBQ5925375.1 peptidylprolyl isomerase [Paludibacteraceae bacterium]
MKKFAFSLFVLLISIVVLGQEKNMIDGVVWVVGDEAILRSDVEQERIRAQYEGQRIQGEPYCIIPEQIAIQKLFIHQAKIDSIEVNDGQVESQVNSQMNFFIRQIGSREKLEEYYRKTYTEIKEEMRQTIADQSLVQQVQQSLVQNIQVTPSDVRKYYNTLSEDSIPTIPAQVEVQIITIEPPIPDDVIEATKNRLREFADRVKSGEADFSMLARLYSDDTESAKQGGELGFAGRGTFVPEFANAAFALTEPGNISRVIETEFGFHIIQLIERRDDRVNCRHILLRPKITSDIKIKTLTTLDSIATDIRTDKLTFDAAASLMSSDKDTKMNNGLMTNQNSGSSKFEYQDLPPEIAKLVYTMKPGEVSEPFSMFSQKLGREVFAIVKLKNYIPTHKANLTDDFQTLKTMCESQLREKTIKEWLKKKILDTYIYISPEWRDCDFEFKEWIKK